MICNGVPDVQILLARAAAPIRICTEWNRGIVRAAVSPDGDWLATGRPGFDSIEVWSARSGDRIAALSGTILSSHDGFEFSRDGRWLLVAGTRSHTVWECGAWRRAQHVRYADRFAEDRGAPHEIGAHEESWRALRLIQPRTHSEVARLTLPTMYDGAGCFLPSPAWIVQSIVHRGEVFVWDLRRVRETLASLALDWDAPPLPPRPAGWDAPFEVHVVAGDAPPLAPSGSPGLSRSVRWARASGGNDHRYTVVHAPRGISWDGAADAAREAGGYLATITSAAESDFVFALVDDPRYWSLAPHGSQFGPWLGGRRSVNAGRVETGWEWVTGEPFDYPNWETPPETPVLEPNNQAGDEACLHRMRHGRRCGAWSDYMHAPTGSAMPVVSFVVEFDE